ncbi:MAG TPA: hypothetical protein PKU94_07555 [Candidatus Hydrothermia bacterium]|nr:hypothetical protein [Candidatus Hydrothermae bacterium]MDD3649754.1 hypothetical protein [Candidatus Hydrothermia bacterium]MDD5573062.1 hypothetical protein [Candidatus Hydrothermia bacterium]HOK23715.1 hypothetical protein [Candidatus Hydrothermia bacterium]HOL24424.1 hypothetical protein [Candidatus Hydrothermia bacterium]
MEKKNIKKVTTKEKAEFKYSKKNWILIFTGVGLGIISLIIMAFGDITISVILFVLGFIILLPIGLLLRP